MRLAPEATLTLPLRWKRGRRIFVNSMSDLFHEDVPDAGIDRVFAVMALSPQHTYQILTKRSARMRAYVTDPATPGRIYHIVCDLSLEQAASVILLARPEHAAHAPPGRHVLLGLWPLQNVWLGVSAEDQRRADERIPDLLATPAAIRFVSAEPLLGPIDFEHIVRPPDCYDKAMPGFDMIETVLLDALGGQNGVRTRTGDEFGDVGGGAKLDWIIVGGESGPQARPMHPDWARSIRDQCEAAGTAFFFKQWGEWKGCGPGRISETNCTALHRWDDRAFSCRVGKKAAGRLLDGGEHNAMPAVAL
jgi:protein gp37